MGSVEEGNRGSEPLSVEGKQVTCLDIMREYLPKNPHWYSEAVLQKMEAVGDFNRDMNALVTSYENMNVTADLLNPSSGRKEAYPHDRVYPMEKDAEFIAAQGAFIANLGRCFDEKGNVDWEGYKSGVKKLREAIVSVLRKQNVIVEEDEGKKLSDLIQESDISPTPAAMQGLNVFLGSLFVKKKLREEKERLGKELSDSAHSETHSD